MSITNAEETNDANGEHKFKVPYLLCVFQHVVEQASSGIAMDAEFLLRR